MNMTSDIIITKQNGLTLPSGQTTVTIFTNKVIRNITAGSKEFNMPILPNDFSTHDPNSLVVDMKQRKRSYQFYGYITSDATRTAKEMLTDLVAICNFGGIFTVQYKGRSSVAGEDTFTASFFALQVNETPEDDTNDSPDQYQVTITVNEGKDAFNLANY